MKYKDYLILFFQFFVVIFQFVKAYKKKGQKKQYFYPSQQIINIQPEIGVVAQIGTSNNQSRNQSRQAITLAKAGDFKLPNNHPIIRDLKRPKYVEKLHFYEDDPGRQRESEAISIDRLDDTYYRPFSNKNLIFQAKSVFNCEEIESPYVCQSSKLCNWDNIIHGCVYVNNRMEVLSEIRFKQHKKKNHHKNFKV
jgi:hypothetical protein